MTLGELFDLIGKENNTGLSKYELHIEFTVECKYPYDDQTMELTSNVEDIEINHTEKQIIFKEIK